MSQDAIAITLAIAGLGIGISFSGLAIGFHLKNLADAIRERNRKQ